MLELLAEMLSTLSFPCLVDSLQCVLAPVPSGSSSAKAATVLDDAAGQSATHVRL